MVVSALGTVFHERSYGHLAFGVFLLGLAFYLITLPATYTGGVIGFAALRHLNGELVLLAFLLALLLSVVLTLNAYSVRTALRVRGAGLSIGAVVASLVPGSVCCTPLVPSMLAAIGASTPQIFGLTGRIQGTVVRYEALFPVLSILLLLVALRLAAQGICGSCRPLERSGIIDASRGESSR